MTASGEVSRPIGIHDNGDNFFTEIASVPLHLLRRVLGLTGLWPSVHKFSIFSTHSHRTAVPPFKTYEYLTAPPYPARSHSLNSYAPCWDGTRNPLTCVPEKVTLSLVKDVRTQGSFSESLNSVCDCGFSFNSSLPLKVLVYLLFLSILRSGNKEQIRGNILLLHNWTFCHIFGLRLLCFTTHLEFFLSDSTPFQGDENVLPGVPVWHGHEPVKKFGKSASLIPLSSRYNYLQYYKSG